MLLNEEVVELSVSFIQSQRIDIYLSELLAIPRQKIKNHIQKGDVTINKHIVKKPAFKLSNRDHVIIRLIQTIKDNQVVDVKYVFGKNIQSDQFNIPIIYEDDHLLIVNKPYGLVVHPGPTIKDITLMDLLILGNVQLAKLVDDRPGIVHRLDQFTEGLLIIAKSNEALQTLQDQFRQRKIIKRYYAVLVGVLKMKDGIIDRPIGRDRSVRARQSCHHFVQGSEKEAITHYSVKNETTTVSFVDINLITGRTHQIRVHFSALNCPVLGDSLYSKQRQRADGYFLQSYQLEFDHPITNDQLSFTLPVSDRLKQYAKDK